MDLLQQTFVGNTVQSWLIAVAITVTLWLALWLMQRLFLARFCRMAARSPSELDDLIANLLKRTSILLLAILAAYGGSLALTFSSKVTEWIKTAALVALLIQMAMWGDELIGFLLARYQKQHLASDADQVTTMRAAGFIVRLALFSLIVLAALDNIPGVEVTSLIASLGIGGIAVALAVQNILADLLASLSITFDRPFGIGDFIAVGDFSGAVEHIGLKTTRLRSVTGEQLVFPNSDLLGSRIRNYKRMQQRRIAFTIRVNYNTPYEKLERIPAIISEIIQSQPHVRFDRAHFSSYGEFSLNFDIVYFMLDPNFALYMDTQQAINLAIYKRFAEEGIEFALPTQALFLKQDGQAVRK